MGDYPQDRLFFVLQYIAPLIILALFYRIGTRIAIPVQKSNRKNTGLRVERMTKWVLENTLLRPVLQNVLFDIRNGMTSETDLIQVSEKGIIAVECKYRDGSIEGSAKDDVWEIYTGSHVEEMPNTIRQNYYHIQAMKEYLEGHGIETESIPIYNVSVINGEGEKKQARDIRNKNTRMYSSWDELEELKQLPDVLKEEEIEKLHALLRKKEATEEQMKEHIERLKEKYENN